jgi:hypothetical protein
MKKRSMMVRKRPHKLRRRNEYVYAPKENNEDDNLYAHDDDMSKLLLRSSLLK